MRFLSSSQLTKSLDRAGRKARKVRAATRRASPADRAPARPRALRDAPAPRATLLARAGRPANNASLLDRSLGNSRVFRKLRPPWGNWTYDHPSAAATSVASTARHTKKPSGWTTRQPSAERSSQVAPSSCPRAFLFVRSCPSSPVGRRPQSAVLQTCAKPTGPSTAHRRDAEVAESTRLRSRQDRMRSAVTASVP